MHVVCGELRGKGLRGLYALGKEGASSTVQLAGVVGLQGVVYVHQCEQQRQRLGARQQGGLSEAAVR